MRLVEGTGRLAGRRILIVGGGQQDYGVEEPPMGNGRAMSILFAREGAQVAAADIDEDAARATGEMSGAVPIHADASDEEVIQSFVRITMNGIRPVSVESNTVKK